MITQVGDLEFRTREGFMKPHEIFYAMAGKHLKAGESDRALALLGAFTDFEGDDPDATAMRGEIHSRGFAEGDVAPGVHRSVQEECDRFHSLPAELRTRMIRPENYIAIHPFEGEEARYKRWVLDEQENVKTKIVTMDHLLWGTCESVEYEIFTAPATGYYDENDEGRIPDFDSFGRQEFVAATMGESVVGVLRLVYSDEENMREGLFQTYDHRGDLHVFPEMEKYLAALDPRKTVDLSTFAVASDVRDSRVSKALITRTMQRIWETERRFALASIDTPFYRKLKYRGLGFRDLGPSTYYWGSPSTASVLDTYSIPKGMSRLFIPYCRAKGFVERARF